MNQLNETLRTQAIELGLCKQWQDNWMQNKSRDELLRMFIRGLGFCIEHNWPSSQWIVGNFAPNELQMHNIFVANKSLNTSLSSCVSYFKECSGEVMFDRYSVSTIYCVDCSNLTFKFENGARSFIHVHNSKIGVNAESNLSLVRVYLHGDTAKAETVGNVAIRTSQQL